MGAVHEDLADAQAFKGGGQGAGGAGAVDKENNLGFGGVVGVLADADAEDGGVGLEQGCGVALLDGDGLGERGGGEGGCGVNG